MKRGSKEGRKRDDSLHPHSLAVPSTPCGENPGEASSGSAADTWRIRAAMMWNEKEKGVGRRRRRRCVGFDRYVLFLFLFLSLSLPLFLSLDGPTLP